MKSEREDRKLDQATLKESSILKVDLKFKIDNVDEFRRRENSTEIYRKTMAI